MDKEYKTLENNKIHVGDALEVLKTFPDNQIDMCITSPPYWGLRDYGVDGQLGLEPNFNDYINRLCTIFDEVKRCLKDSGTCWVNIGDGYASGAGSLNTNKGDSFHGGNKKHRTQTGIKAKNLPPKSLIGIPFRFALEMINRGWILRNTIIWYKPNCMPSSVKDRFTVDFEYLFFFSKNKKYYFEQQFEPVKQESIDRINQNSFESQEGGAKDYGKNGVNPNRSMRKTLENFKKNFTGKRNKRTVWKITTKPYKGAHFAVFPPELIETPIKAGCPEFICNECGKPRIKLYKKTGFSNEGNEVINRSKAINLKEGSPQERIRKLNGKSYKKVEFLSDELSDCGCNAGFHQGIVLDPFIGSGTTAAVAKSLGRNYIGIELNPDYLDLIKNRVNETIRPLESFIKAKEGD